MVADALSQKSRGALASIAPREWQMLKTVGAVWTTVHRAGSGYIGESGGYAVSLEQGDRVLGAGRRDSVHQGPGTVKYGRQGLDHPHKW